MTAILSNERLIETDRSDAFDALFLAHYDRVYGILFRLLGTRAEAEDIAQEVFLKLYQLPAAKQVNVSAWLYRVATNAGYNAIRGRKRRWQWQTWLVDSAETPSPSQLLERDETCTAVRDALAQLKPQQAQLLLLRHMGMSYAELADACDMNAASVGKQLARAGEAFRKAYLLTTERSHV